MHQNTQVLVFTMDESTGIINHVEEVCSPSHVPVGVCVKNGVVDRAGLNHWWIGRSIPASRSGLREALELLNTSSSELLLKKCLGLSLSDQYWIRPQDSKMQWRDVNFFDHSFSEDVGRALFGQTPKNTVQDLMSPDNTSDGWLRKKWVVKDGMRCLVKGGSLPFQQEPINEAIASVLMDRMGAAVRHVHYDLLWEDGLPYSMCEDFITRDTELVTAWRIYNTSKKPNHVSVYEHFTHCCDVLGIPDVRSSLDKLLTVDYLIANTDRHMNNIGAVRNANTLEWIGLSPIFDCGTSLWHNQPTNLVGTDATECRPFAKSHDRQIQLVSSFDWLDVSRLADTEHAFADLLSESPYIDADRRSSLSSAFAHRIESLNRIVSETK